MKDNKCLPPQKKNYLNCLRNQKGVLSGLCLLMALPYGGNQQQKNSLPPQKRTYSVVLTICLAQFIALELYECFGCIYVTKGSASCICPKMLFCAK